MGVKNSYLKKQIKHYYIFHKQIEDFFKKGRNQLYNLINKSKKAQLENFYVIDKNLIDKWKKECKYDIYKTYFDEINIDNNNFAQYKNKIEKKRDELTKTLELGIRDYKFNNPENIVDNWFMRNTLQLEHFDNLLDENSYQYFKDNLSNKNETNIKGIFTDDKLILLYDKFYEIKFLYYGKLGVEQSQNNDVLIQLTAEFTQDKNGLFEESNIKEAYNAFVKMLENNIDNIFNLFESKNIRFLREQTINFSNYNFLLRNENLNSCFLNANYTSIIPNKLNFNKFRLIGLINVGAACYMNATLQCFINIPSLTNFFLDKKFYKYITHNSNIFELSSAYCNLLYHIRCDENVKKYYDPTNFKNIICSKNPLLKSRNGNDPKDLINLILEVMNQELTNIYIKSNQANINNKQIIPSDKYIMLDILKTDFSKNNNTIIAKNFFFIGETKTNCQICNHFQYNYQAIYFLIFPLELVYNYCINNSNNNFINKNGYKFISLEKCFEQYYLKKYFTNEKKLFCYSCNKLTDTLCQSRIYSLPKTLIIILNRGKGTEFNYLIDFPYELNLSQYVLCPQSISKYQLSGVITCTGQNELSKHFVAFCKYTMDNKWYKYDDSVVCLCQNQNNDYKQGIPYVLFYESCDGKDNVLFDGKKVDNNSFYNKNSTENFPINNINNNMMINMNNNFNNMKMNNCNNNLKINNNCNNMNMNNLLNNNCNNMNMKNNLMNINNNMNNNINNINNNLNNINNFSMMNNNNFNNNNNFSNNNNNFNEMNKNSFNNMNNNCNNNFNMMNNINFNNMNNNMNNNCNNMNNNCNNMNNNCNNMNNNFNNMSNNCINMNNNMNNMSNNCNNMNNNMNNMNINFNNMNNNFNNMSNNCNNMNNNFNNMNNNNFNKDLINKMYNNFNNNQFN